MRPNSPPQGSPAQLERLAPSARRQGRGRSSASPKPAGRPGRGLKHMGTARGRAVSLIQAQRLEVPSVTSSILPENRTPGDTSPGVTQKGGGYLLGELLSPPLRGAQAHLKCTSSSCSKNSRIHYLPLSWEMYFIRPYCHCLWNSLKLHLSLSTNAFRIRTIFGCDSKVPVE